MALEERDAQATTGSLQRWLAALLSLAIPGLGQVFRGRIRRGLILFPLPAVAVYAFCHSGALNDFPGALMLLLVELTIWVTAVLDAFFRAQAQTMPAARLRFTIACLLVGCSLGGAQPAITHFLMGNVRIFGVPGVSMSPTLEPGDWVVIALGPGQAQPPDHGEIVAFRHQGQTYARRVIGVAGDTIAFQGGRVQRNRQWLDESYADLSPVAGVDPDDVAPVQVASDAVYLLGDARNRSLDSHSPGYGPVHTTDILGTAQYVVWGQSLDRIGKRLR